ncbi:MAG: bluetail domain-containing putative surface protein [Cyanobacteriota bacterium]
MSANRSLLTDAVQTLLDFASGPLFAEKFALAFGIPAPSLAAFRSALAQLPEVEVLADEVLEGALGAFSVQTDKIYLSESLVNGDGAQLRAVLLEEIGHYLDSVFNSQDATGDEGAIFAALVQGEVLDLQTLRALMSEDDFEVLLLSDQSVFLEKADFTGTNGDDIITGTSGNDNISGLDGNDTLSGLGGNDIIIGGNGNDLLNGGNGSDDYRIQGYLSDDYSTFEGHDTYADNGTTGSDRIVALRAGNVDIGLTTFAPTSGIEIIDGTGATGTVTLLGDWSDNVLNFSATTLVGSNFQINGDWGNDTITGTGGNDVIIGGGDQDSLNGGNGSDDYRVRGYLSDSYWTFEGYDTYADNGTTGSDRIVALRAGNVDIGLTTFAPTSGIEIIDGTGATGTVTLLGDWSDNVLDFSATTLVGSNFQINGSWGNDTITGTGGNDIIIGGGNEDSLNGGNGSDDYRVRGYVSDDYSTFEGHDTYADNGTTGSDRIVALRAGNVDIGLTTFASTSGIEIIDGTGATGIVTLLGDWGDNVLDFSATTFVGSNVQINGSWGNDTITGTTGNDVIIGGGNDDTLNGGNGNDTLQGTNGGLGERDYLVGGAGSDRFILADTANTFYDDGNSALPGDYDYATIADFNTTNDTIQLRGSSGDYLLSVDGSNTKLYINKPGSEPDELVAVINNQTALSLTASYFSYVSNPTFTGTTGNDRLNGTTGADTLIGLAGNDIYTVNNAGDVVVENLNEGTDTVNASIAYTLPNNVENLTLNGSANINGTGNTANNKLTGNAGNNTLTGLAGNDALDGKAGADTLIGGLGNDTYTVDNVGDVITENANEGTDSVKSSINYTLGANLENLTLTGSAGINGTGNALKNKITGNTGANILNGGAGADTLAGKGGNDIFVFQFGQSTVTALDRISDFAIGADKIDLLTQGGAVTGAPAGFTRAADSATTKINTIVTNVFTDADGATAGNQDLGLNRAALVKAGSSTYLIVNDGVAGFQNANDLVINLTGITGTLPAFGAISVGNFFV